MKVYMDNCCYNRPFDNQNQERIYLESEAILAVVKRAQKKIDVIIGSAILDLEMGNTKDERKKRKVEELYDIAEIHIPFSGEIKKRSLEIISNTSIRTMDSLHIASAEAAGADVMLTTDDKLEKISVELNLQVRVINPLKYVTEVL